MTTITRTITAVLNEYDTAIENARTIRNARLTANGASFADDRDEWFTTRPGRTVIPEHIWLAAERRLEYTESKYAAAIEKARIALLIGLGVEVPDEPETVRETLSK